MSKPYMAYREREVSKFTFLVLSSHFVAPARDGGAGRHPQGAGGGCAGGAGRSGPAGGGSGRAGGGAGGRRLRAYAAGGRGCPSGRGSRQRACGVRRRRADERSSALPDVELPSAALPANAADCCAAAGGWPGGGL